MHTIFSPFFHFFFFFSPSNWSSKFFIFTDEQTVVISAKGYQDFHELVTRKNHVYIGRLNKFVKGSFDSKWGNPFSAKRYRRIQCLDLYKQYLYSNKALLSDIQELHGKTLVCWCAPKLCHGQILANLCNKGLQ